MTSKATIILPDGQRIPYHYYAPGGHWWASQVTHKVRERTLREQYLYPYIKNDDVFMDVGAAYGSWAVPAAILGGFVYAFEPRAPVAWSLDKNMQMNGLENYLIFQYAVADGEQESITMCTAGDSSTIRDDQTHVSCSAHDPVSVTTVDATVERYGIGRVDWLKIDAEGVEVQALEGARNTIMRHMPNLIVECHMRHDSDTLDAVVAFVQSTGLPYELAVAASFGWNSGDRPHLVYLRPETI